MVFLSIFNLRPDLDANDDDICCLLTFRESNAHMFTRSSFSHVFGATVSFSSDAPVLDYKRGVLLPSDPHAAVARFKASTNTLS